MNNYVALTITVVTHVATSSKIVIKIYLDCNDDAPFDNIKDSYTRMLNKHVKINESSKEEVATLKGETLKLDIIVKENDEILVKKLCNLKSN